MAQTVSTLTVDLVANSAKFTSEMRKAGKSSKSFSDGVRKSTATAAKALAGVGTAAAVGFGAIYTQSAKVGDQVAKTADSIGITTEALTRLNYAAELTGAGTATMESSLVRMSKRLGEFASTGKGSAAKTLEQLGLATEDFLALKPEEQFAGISDKISGLGTAQEKAAAASALFGREGIALINTMAGGADGLASMAAEADTLGITLSRVDAAKMEAANDAMYKAGKISDAFGQTLAGELAPLVEGVANEFLGAAMEAGGFAEVTTKGVDYAVKAVATLANVVRGLQVAWKAVKAAAATAISGMLQGVAWLDDGITTFLNHLPGVEIQTNNLIQGMAESMSETAAGMRKELHDLAMEPLPYDGIVKWAEEVQSKANDAAKKVAEDRAGSIGQSFNPDLTGTGTTGQKKAAITGASQSGIMDGEEARRVAARERFAVIEEEQQSSLERQKTATEDFAQQTGSILGDAYGKSFGEIKDQFLSMLTQMAADQLASSIGSMGGGMGGGMGGSSGWAGLATQAFAGFFDSGGTIPSGKVGMVGERRPELIAGPATVVGGAKTAQLMKNANSGSTNITNNFPGVTDAREARQAASVAGRQTQRAIAMSKGYN